MASTSGPKNEAPGDQQVLDVATAAQRLDNANTAAQPDAAPSPSAPKRQNAFTQLMHSAKKLKPSTSPQPPSSPSKPAKNPMKSWDPRNGLAPYIEHPEENPEGRVVQYDQDFVVVRDKFPKASVHLLLLPRRTAYASQHPLRLLSSDPNFLAAVRERVEGVKHLAASELHCLHGHVSASDKPFLQAREAILSSLPHPPTPEQLASLPKGRDWAADVVVGVHTHPSMNHLHIHVISRDMHSACMKHKKHYLSYNSDFLVKLHEFPLQENSPRHKAGDWTSLDMKCWRCGRSFGNRFKSLKEHLEEEWDAWRRE